MAASMMLDFLGEREAATAIETAVAGLLQSGRIRSLGTDSGHTTSEIGDLVVAQFGAAQKVA